jgi:hypothetical protein
MRIFTRWMNSRRKAFLTAAALQIALLFFSVPSRGQETTARLVGNIVDPSGAPVSGAVVRVQNAATSISRETKTDASGDYSLPLLPVGDYSVTATATGFQEQNVSHIILQVQQAARVDFKLTIGNVTERVEISATAAALQTENAAVGTVIDSAKSWSFPSTDVTSSNWPN